MHSISASMQYGVQAMNAHAWGMATTAHNVANVHTAGFKPQRTVLATGADVFGVQVDAVVQDVTSTGQRSASVQSTAMLQASPSIAPEMLNPSNTDVARESANMVTSHWSYAANAKIVETADSMLGYLLDMKA